MGIGEGVIFDTRESKKKLRGSFLLPYIPNSTKGWWVNETINHQKQGRASYVHVGHGSDRPARHITFQRIRARRRRRLPEAEARTRTGDHPKRSTLGVAGWAYELYGRVRIKTSKWGLDPGNRLETLFKASTTPQNEALKTETVSSKSSQVLILRTCKTRSTALDSSRDQHRNASKRRYRRDILKNRIKPCLIAMADHIARQRRAKKKHGVTRLFADWWRIAKKQPSCLLCTKIGGCQSDTPKNTRRCNAILDVCLRRHSKFYEKHKVKPHE